jgi:rhodanese-related sulfurtransferase
MSPRQSWKQQIIFSLLIIGMAFIRVSAQALPDPKATGVEFITAEELKAKVTDNHPVTIIDVRASESYAASATTIKGAMHFKVRRLKSRLALPPLKDLPRDQMIVTYCACPRDESSTAAAQILQASGFKRVRVLKGGWQEWLRSNGQVQARAKG